MPSEAGGDQDPDAVATGAIETPLEVGQYSDPNHSGQFAWYDVPSSGTLKIPDWQHLNSRGLYVFDWVTVARLTATDRALLTNCRRFRIPTFVVRSKADQHIRNLMQEVGYGSDDETEKEERVFEAARDRSVTETCRVKENLSQAQLSVYIVSHKALGVVRVIPPKKTIAEKSRYDEAYRGSKHASGARKWN